jgi:hypothetical protein
MNRGKLALWFAIAGEAFAAFPFAATVFTSIAGSISMRKFVLDWLMPAELFPAAGLGAVLLMAGAILLKRYRALTGGLSGGCLAMLLGSQAYATLSGLAEGRADTPAAAMAIATAGIAAYCAFLAAIIVAGAFLIRAARRAARP